MDTNFPAAPPKDDFFRKKYTSTVSFALGILLFMLPFAQFKCASVTLAENSGIGITIGTRWKIVDMGGMGNKLMENAKNEQKVKTDLLKTGPNVFLILSLLSAFLGFGLSLSENKMRHVAGLCTGILSAIMLIAMLVQYKLLLRSAFRDIRTDYDMSGVMGIHFTLWYFLSLASFAAAAFFSFKHHQIEFRDALANHVDFEFQRGDAGNGSQISHTSQGGQNSQNSQTGQTGQTGQNSQSGQTGQI